MQLNTTLNHVTNYKPFVIASAKFFDDEQTVIEVTMRARANGSPLCSACNKSGSCYGTLPVRRFDFIPLWMILGGLIYARRRVNCLHCGVKVE